MAYYYTRLNNPIFPILSQAPAPARSLWTHTDLMTPASLRRRVCSPLLDALHSPHDSRPHGPHGEGSEGIDDSVNRSKTEAKASSLPLELTPSRSSTTQRRKRAASRGHQQQQLWAESVRQYVEILRPQNIAPAMLLVLMGAWVCVYVRTNLAHVDVVLRTRFINLTSQLLFTQTQTHEARDPRRHAHR